MGFLRIWVWLTRGTATQGLIKDITETQSPALRNYGTLHNQPI